MAASWWLPLVRPRCSPRSACSGVRPSAQQQHPHAAHDFVPLSPSLQCFDECVRHVRLSDLAVCVQSLSAPAASFRGLLLHALFLLPLIRTRRVGFGVLACSVVCSSRLVIVFVARPSAQCCSLFCSCAPPCSCSQLFVPPAGLLLYVSARSCVLALH